METLIYDGKEYKLITEGPYSGRSFRYYNHVNKQGLVLIIDEGCEQLSIHTPGDFYGEKAPIAVLNKFNPNTAGCQGRVRHCPLKC